MYPDDHEVNSQKELDYETEIDWELNADREFTQPEHDQEEDQEEELVPIEQEIQNNVDSGSSILVNLVLSIQLGREPSRVDIFKRSFSKADITNNSEAVKQLEQMKELSKELPEGSLDEPGLDDIYAQVRGTAKHVQAEMYGLGVRVSDVWGEVRSRAALCQENVKLKAELQEYKEREKQKNIMTDNSVVNPHASTNNGIITNTPLQVGKEVHLKSINYPTLIVAKGRLRSLDPLTVVGGIKIGPGRGEVHVQVAIKSDQAVIRPFEFVTTMIEATGVTIAWPTSLLSVVPLD
ncbi:uncharacterized protein [Rutidosis leptorrhynchoides]|uniref:uncharacterized protein n=1 Tax=Rutidosis leptorrhynchoides TaxID=125765 RepID=UPI003A994ADF